MKRKTIDLLIRRKMHDWIGTLPEELRDRARKEVVVTGGCIASMLMREKVSDYDIYFRSRQLVEDISRHYITTFVAHRLASSGINIPISLECTDDRVRIIIKSAGIASADDSQSEYAYFEGRPPEEAQGYVSEVMNDPGEIEQVYEDTEAKVLGAEEVTPESYRPVFMSTNAMTLSGKVQVIIRFWGSPEEIHENYDFVHCMNYWTFKEGVVLKPEALEAILTKELRYVGSRYPVCSVIRTRKFINRGWSINAGQFVKMCFQISQLDLNNLRVLEDQLTGVDVAYFIEVVRLMEERDKERVDSAYLIEIIDRMF